MERGMEMKLLKALRELFCRVRWKEGALCVLLQLVLRLMVAAPLLALVTREVPWLALLSVVLFILIVPVARQNMAEAMQASLNGGALFSTELVSFRHYGRKLAQGLKTMGLLLCWAIPFLAATAVLVWAYSGQMDGFTLMRTVQQLGGGVFMTGIKVVLLMYAATLLPILVGCAFHSGVRHAAALGNKKLIKGHRMGLMLNWFAGLLFLLPFLAVAVYESADFISGLMQGLNSFSSGSISLPAVDEKIYIIGLAFVVLGLPGLALKQLLTADYVRRLKS